MFGDGAAALRAHNQQMLADKRLDEVLGQAGLVQVARLGGLKRLFRQERRQQTKREGRRMAAVHRSPLQLVHRTSLPLEGSERLTTPVAASPTVTDGSCADQLPGEGPYSQPN